jgi:hypothetical protein
MNRTRQTSLFGETKPVVAAIVKKAETTCPTWFDADFWAALPQLERNIHCIAHDELGNSYTVESTQAFEKWVKSGRPGKWSVLDEKH